MFSAVCFSCFSEIHKGRGYALSCQCFYCDECAQTFLKSKNSHIVSCPICASQAPDIASLKVNEIPSEIQSLLNNPIESFINELKEVFSFQLTHYKTIIKNARLKINELEKKLISEKRFNI